MNILFLLGILIFLLAINWLTTDYSPDINIVYGDSLIEHCDIFVTSILGLLIFVPIEMLFHKIMHNKFILNIPFGNEGLRYTYNILFWLGIVCSILYLLFYLWFITR